MKKRVCRIIGWALLCVLIFTACGAPSANEEKTTIQTAPSDTPLQENTLKSNEIVMEIVYGSPNWLNYAAEKFEEKTGVKVKIINRFEDLDVETVDVPDNSTNGSIEISLVPYPDSAKYTERTEKALMTGSGADIYEVQFLDFENLGANNLLCDLTQWVNSDPNLKKDKVFRNILLSAQTEKGLFAVPVNFGTVLVCASSESEPQLEYKNMTWKEFFETTQILPITGRIWSESDLEIFISRFRSASEEFIDEKNKTQTLNSPKMIALLEEGKAWRDKGFCAGVGNPSTFTTPYLYAGKFIMDGLSAAQYLCKLPQNRIDGLPVMAPMISDTKNFEDVGANLVGLYGINANSPNKEIAWQFLQYLLSPEIQMMLAPSSSPDSPGIYSDGLAINREAFRQQVEDNLKEIQEDEPSLKVYDKKEKYISEAEARLDRVDKMAIEKPYYQELIYEVAKEYFLDKITAEEAAQRMADKVGLYLKEQG